jgi:hypothetical protein
MSRGQQLVENRSIRWGQQFDRELRQQLGFFREVRKNIVQKMN